MILLRTPYNRKFVLLGSQRFAERGYVVVAQDTRGRFESGGKFTMLKDEKADGVDTMRWIKQQVRLRRLVGGRGAAAPLPCRGLDT